MDYDDVCVLIPTLNEAATIGSVVEEFSDAGFDRILVIDGNSEDDTQEIAADAGADVTTQSGSGKGQAVREALELIDRPYILMLDGDGTYPVEDAGTMLEPLFAGDAEHVIGNRFADMEAGAMSRLNQFGNRLLNGAFRAIHHRNHHDILSGYRAFTRDSAQRCDLSADGFGIETEFAVECVKKRIDTTEVPITYRARPAGSETNLHPLRDGFVIGLTLYRLAKTNNPLFYFGSVGVAALAAGGVTAAYVGYRWVALGIGHEVLAIVAAAGILLGVQLVMFGVLSDMFVSLHREQARRLDRIEDRVEDAELSDDE